MSKKESLRSRRRQAARQRDFSRRAAIVAGSVGTAGLGLYLLDRRFGIFSGERLGSEYPEVLRYYPEMAEQPVRENGVFQTTQTSVRWFNFGDARFDPDAAARIFSYFEEISDNGIISSIHNPSGEDVYFEARPNPVVRPEHVFITSAEAPNPSWLTDWGQGGTYRGFDGSVNLTRIPLVSPEPGLEREVYDTVEKNANKIFIIEACQNSVNVISSDPETPHYFQEAFCVGSGTAVAFRQMKVTYSGYTEFVHDKAFQVPAGTIPFVELDEVLYHEIPVFSPAIHLEQ
ncbi:MAG: hypothetical protein A2785_03020 [Candidatus Chisholmbacteria bacterium RIFCSPHIGHO2_01_FULL_49_18]|uniref:Uncharacterized protein n=2 Tax=Candidatus Chisholmiibacteriota TaxID=1817900 RepID=A0A1G1VMB9_9BACT|nr:MAG: hypothetical protein A2785_03020 [Candidatus Chisholmbacteria bacterium RIFCSPHIGHO2_01_FULL_49_18]OGY21002.1 MAG: hypothetical protein A3A65_01680 [Candidatus Chisholmbacteria bacterium RIFCSPLOWO2_01_FULL_49_14]